MVRLTCLLMCLLLIAGISVAYAAPVGNIATPSVLKKGLIIQDEQGQYGVIVESENDITWDRNLKDQYSDTEYSFFGGKCGILFMDRYIAYGILGAGKALQKFQADGNNIKWDTDYSFVWGIGGTAMLYETKVQELWNGTFRIGLDGRYRQSHLDVDKVTGDSTNFNLTPSAVTSSKYELDEWQVALAVSYQIENVIPYVGVKYSDTTGEAETTANGTEYKVDLEADDNVGIFTGCDLVLNDMFSINVEGRFIDETALTAAAAIRF